MSTAVVALPDILDPMYWLGANGVFGSAVLPGILIIVFIETGLLFPLLPGESLLFTGGLLAAHPNPPASIWVLAPSVALVAVLGDQTGYFIGRRIGPALFKKEDSRFFKQHYVTESHAFFEKYGPWAIILARFAPFVHQNLEKIILAILLISLLPAFIAAWRGYQGRRRAPRTPKDEAESGHPASAVRNESV